MESQVEVAYRTGLRQELDLSISCVQYSSIGDTGVFMRMKYEYAIQIFFVLCLSLARVSFIITSKSNSLLLLGIPHLVVNLSSPSGMSITMTRK